MKTRRVVVSVVALMLLGGACSSSDTGDGAEGTTSTSTTEAPERALRILVTNDDGVGAEGIAAVVDALVAMDNTEVTVVAPKENQSGSASKTTDIEALDAAPAETANGYAATAVDGFPADSIIYALDQGGIDFVPDLVVSGINDGQNIAEFVELSGTVGAARAAVARGIPALAASQGFGDPADFESGIEFVVDWVAEAREDLLSGDAAVEVANLNIPTCEAGAIRGVVEVRTAISNNDRKVNPADCTSTFEEFEDDLDAFMNGFVTLSVVDS